jgi:hypothetical protein
MPQLADQHVDRSFLASWSVGLSARLASATESGTNVTASGAPKMLLFGGVRDYS